MDFEMLNDLLFAGGWKEANWGLWLAALAPKAEYFPLLDIATPSENYSTDILDLAISSCTLKVPPRLTEHFALLQSIREILNEMLELKTPMRVYANSNLQFECERSAVLKAYRKGGVTLALPLTKKGIVGYYAQSYVNWIRSGALPAPVARNKPWWRL